MKFNKTLEHIIRFENFSGYFLIREFQYDKETLNPVGEFMKTKYFSWQEDFRNEISVTVNNTEKIVDWNFHGLYDIKKLQPEHFIKVKASDFIDQFKEIFQSEIGIDKNLRNAHKNLNALTDLSSEFYLIKNLSEDLKHEWTVFNFFLSGFKISIDKKVLTAVEFGLD